MCSIVQVKKPYSGSIETTMKRGKIFNKECPTPDKIVFTNKRSVWNGAVYVKRNYGNNVYGYKCRCGSYHLTSIPHPIPKRFQEQLNHVSVKYNPGLLKRIKYKIIEWLEELE